MSIDCSSVLNLDLLVIGEGDDDNVIVEDDHKVSYKAE